MGVPLVGNVAEGNLLPQDGALSDSDWEYEYDESQTEDFYFTLDLPAYKEPASKRRKITKSEKAALNASTDSRLGPDRTPYLTNGLVPQAASGQTASEERLHFSDLHTTTPVIEAGGQRYECQWTTDLGTQFHVSTRGLTAKPFRAGRAVDVVALSRVRLTGRQAETQTPLPVKRANGASAGDAIALDDEDDDDADEPNARPPTLLARGPPRGAFLDRIREIQASKVTTQQTVANGATLSVPMPPSSTTRIAQQVVDPAISHGAIEVLPSTASHTIQTSAAEPEHMPNEMPQPAQPELHANPLQIDGSETMPPEQPQESQAAPIEPPTPEVSTDEST